MSTTQRQELGKEEEAKISGDDDRDGVVSAKMFDQRRRRSRFRLTGGRAMDATSALGSVKGARRVRDAKKKRRD